jgi:hypothetical protein
MRTRAGYLILLEEITHHDKGHDQTREQQWNAEEESDAAAQRKAEYQPGDEKKQTDGYGKRKTESAIRRSHGLFGDRFFGTHCDVLIRLI